MWWIRLSDHIYGDLKTTILRNKYIFHYKQHTENYILCKFRYIVYSHFQPYFSYIVAVRFISGGNRSTRPVASHWQTLSHNFAYFILCNVCVLKIMSTKLGIYMLLPLWCDVLWMYICNLIGYTDFVNRNGKSVSQMTTNIYPVVVILIPSFFPSIWSI